MAKGNSWKGVGDATPQSQPKSDTMDSQAGRKTQNFDWKGLKDSTPDAQPKSNSVKVGG